MSEHCFSDVTAVRDAIRTRAASASEILRAHLNRIERLDGGVKSYISVDRAGALAQARSVDASVMRRETLGPLAGVPVAVKDNLVTRALTTTAGSRILGDYRPVYDAHVVERLRAAGAIIVGKTNLDEFAMGSSTENSAFGPTRNPWDQTRVPGGSSGGSAAAVAAGLATVALGSDTGGSIRQPAALCGVVGLKPTWGRVSRYGLIAFASSLDQVGPIARSARDAATVLTAIAGHDPRDSTSTRRSLPDMSEALEGPLGALRIGVPGATFWNGVDDEVETAVRAALDTLVAEGATLVDVALPDPDHALAAYYVIAPAEASSNLARFDGVRYGLRAPADKLRDMYESTRGNGFGAEVKRRIMLGTYALSAGYYDAYYARAQRVRAAIAAGFDAAFERCDVICSPTSPITAPGLGEKVGDPLAMYLMDVYTTSANLAGIPGISVPCGFSASGLPIGLQLLGRRYDEETLLRAAHIYEQRTEWNATHPLSDNEEDSDGRGS